MRTREEEHFGDGALAAFAPRAVVAATAGGASGIRPFERTDVGAVARLYQAVVRQSALPPSPRLAALFERTFFDCPWADPDIPSLVHEDAQGVIRGFIGSHPRRAVLDGRPVRVACSGQLFTDPQVRTSAIGALLARRYMSGPQDVTITDGATEEFGRLWRALHGQSSALGVMEWVRIFRPASVAAELLSRRGSARRLMKMARPLARAVDALALWPARSPLRSATPPTIAEPLTPALINAHLSAVAGSYRLHVAYDRPFLDWLFREMGLVTRRGMLVGMLVRSGAGQVLGWYLYYLQPGGFSEVVQVAATERSVDAVLDHLFHHAQAHGTAALRGRLERRLLESTSRRGCLFRYCGMAMVHARDPEILRVVQLDPTLLTRLDGEWWMSHHLEPFSD